MSLSHRPFLFALPLLVAALLLPETIFAQSTLRSRMMERARESRESSGSTAQAATEALSEAMENENASEAIQAVQSSVGEKLEGQSTEDLIKAAQQRIQRSREGTPSAPTITDTTQPATPRAQPTAAQGNTAQPMIPEPVAASRAPAPQAQTQTPAPAPGGQLLTQASPAPTGATPPPAIATPANVPPPVPLQPRYEKEKGTNTQVMEIEADESVMDNQNRLITFTGHVIVTEPRFTLTSDRLDVWMNDDTNLDGTPTNEGAAASDEDRAPFKRAIATGGMVEIEKIGADGKVQIAKARKADYDATTGDIILSGGPPTLQSGSGFVNPSSPDAVIILRADGNHQIKGGTGRNKISIPLKGGGGGASTGGGLPTGNLESITNRPGN